VELISDKKLGTPFKTIKLTALQTKVNFGCFNKNVSGWIGVDYAWKHIIVSKCPLLSWLLWKTRLLNYEQHQWHKKNLFKSVKYGDARKKLRFSSNSVDYIYSSHMIEHLFYDEAVWFFRESFRILRKNGIMRICLPAWDQAKSQDNFDNSLFAKNKKQLRHSHKWLWTFDSLKLVLSNIGFKNISQHKFQAGNFPELRELETRTGLIIQAQK